MQQLHTEDKQEAYHALRSVLFTVRDRVPTELAAHLGAELPLLIRGIYYEGFDPGKQPQRFRKREEWIDYIASFEPDGDPEPSRATRAVFHVLQANLDEGICTKLFQALPETARDLWEDIPEPVAHQA